MNFKKISIIYALLASTFTVIPSHYEMKQDLVYRNHQMMPNIASILLMLLFLVPSSIAQPPIRFQCLEIQYSIDSQREQYAEIRDGAKKYEITCPETPTLHCPPSDLPNRHWTNDHSYDWAQVGLRFQKSFAVCHEELKKFQCLEIQKLINSQREQYAKIRAEAKIYGITCPETPVLDCPSNNSIEAGIQFQKNFGVCYKKLKKRKNFKGFTCSSKGLCGSGEMRGENFEEFDRLLKKRAAFKDKPLKPIRSRDDVLQIFRPKGNFIGSPLVEGKRTNQLIRYVKGNEKTAQAVFERLAHKNNVNELTLVNKDQHGRRITLADNTKITYWLGNKPVITINNLFPKKPKREIEFRFH